MLACGARRFSRKEQGFLDGFGQFRPGTETVGRRVRVGAERERITRPIMKVVFAQGLFQASTRHSEDFRKTFDRRCYEKIRMSGKSLGSWAAGPPCNGVF